MKFFGSFSSQQVAEIAPVSHVYLSRRKQQGTYSALLVTTAQATRLLLYVPHVLCLLVI